MWRERRGEKEERERRDESANSGGF
uniref:Uncharacterized protein n=1 Tax=Arundo donax TaxID=35708 RepID=A0A0A9H1E1_ARUDO